MAKKKKNAPSETGGVAKTIMIWVVKAYVFLMLAVYPLYFQDKYYDMCNAKWHFFRNVTSFLFAAAVVILAWYIGCFIAARKTGEFFKGACKSISHAFCPGVYGGMLYLNDNYPVQAFCDMGI